MQGTSFRATDHSQERCRRARVGVAVAVVLMLSLHAGVEKAGVVADADRIADRIVGAGEDEAQQPGPGQNAATRVARAAATRHRVTHGRTKTRRGREITIGNGGTTGRWARQEGPAASRYRRDHQVTDVLIDYRTRQK